MKPILTRTINLLLLFVLFYNIGYSQVPVIQWKYSLGGSGDDYEKNVQQTKDGGYIIGGWTNSNNGDVKGNHGKIDYWIVKLDSARVIEWNKCLGGSNDDGGDGDMGGITIQQTTDSGYIIAANTQSADGDITSNHGGIDYWIIKLNKTGSIEWQKTLGGTKNDIARSIQQTLDGGYIVAGSSSSNDGNVSGNHGSDDYWVVKLNKIGNITWQKCIGGSGGDYAFNIKQTKDKGYIIAGYTDSTVHPLGPYGDDWNYFIVKLNSSGKVIWQKLYGGTGEDYATDIIESGKGGYLVTGYTASNDWDVTTAYGNYDSWIIKITAQGSIEWQKTYGGSGDDAITNVQQTKDGGYIMAQVTSSNDFDVDGNHGSFDSWITKINPDGVIEWKKILGGTDEDYATSIQQTNDGGYLVGNFSASNDGDVGNNKGGYDYWMVKLAPQIESNIDSIWFLIPDKSLKEGSNGKKVMSYSVKLNKKSTKIIKVNYSTQNVTAIAGSDYDSASGTLTFAPGTLSAAIGVTINGDKNNEKDETFKIVLSNPANAIIKDKEAVIKIVNDDPASISTQLTSDISATNKKQIIKISPNPANSFIAIRFEGYTGKLVIQLLDIAGKTLKQQELQVPSIYTTTEQMDISNIANGNYLLTVTDEKGNRETKKLIIAR